MGPAKVSATVERQEHARRARQRVIVGLTIALLLGACEEGGPAYPSRPHVPSGWTTIEVASGDIRMVLPPWLVPFESRSALFANEPPAPGAEAFLELIAEGPRTVASQPGLNESLDRWLANRIGPAGAGPDAVRAVGLPIGRGIQIDRAVDRAPGQAWRLSAYAIRTRLGVAFLLIDGPAAAWPVREADAALIPMLMELGPG